MIANAALVSGIVHLLYAQTPGRCLTGSGNYEDK